MRNFVVGEVLKFFAGTLNTVALAFLVVGFINPYVERKPLPAMWELGTADKLTSLGLEPFNPGVNINWLLTAVVVYFFALIAIAASKALTYTGDNQCLNR